MASKKEIGTPWTEERLQQLLKEGKIRGYKIINTPKKMIIPPDQQQPKKASKYRNTICYYEGERFDSIRERKRWIRLKWEERIGVITNLRRQVKYQLNQDGNFSYEYIADFVYTNTGSGMEVVEDSKGTRTQEYKRKCKLMEQIHGIKIKET